MSFSTLRDIFAGRLDVDSCVRSVLSMKSPSNVKKYLRNVHLAVFYGYDDKKNERWKDYPCGQNVSPILEKDLSDPVFMDKYALRLSFDIARFMEFLEGYTEADFNIKPIMLHYSMIYLMDFFSRTWLKYEKNRGHGLKFSEEGKDYIVTIQESGAFPRASDAFYLLYESTLFSADDRGGVGTQKNIDGEILFPKIDKCRYTERPKIRLTDLIAASENLESHRYFSRLDSNRILIEYAILFATSSISRYNAEGWHKIQGETDLRNRLDLVQYNFLYEWIPSILNRTILTEGLERRSSLS